MPTFSYPCDCGERHEAKFSLRNPAEIPQPKQEYLTPTLGVNAGAPMLVCAE